jgi:hypothetical protein
MFGSGGLARGGGIGADAGVERNEKPGPSTGVRAIGGRPLALPPFVVPPGRQADDTFLAPRRCRPGFDPDGVTAERGSMASSQKDVLVDGVMAELGHPENGVCDPSLGPREGCADRGASRGYEVWWSGMFGHGMVLPCCLCSSIADIGEARRRRPGELVLSFSPGLLRPLLGRM